MNPSLWRQAKLNAIHGLFEVSDRIYQVRGYDLANMSLVESDNGWIVIDPMTTKETATAAMDLVREHLGERPVVALLYTHSHIDHFGGARAVLSDEDLERGVPVIAPEGFVVEAVSENVLAGTAMTRRASYMFGFLLGRGPRGHVDSGLGKASTPGSFGLIRPTEIVSRTGTEMTLDGVRVVFQNTPGAEAPAEMMFYFPELKALCGAENVSHVLHNLYTLRGAKVRDALRWSAYIDETIALFGDAEVLFASHHWPTWGRERIIEYLKKQRDVYKYIHDQTLRLANQRLHHARDRRADRAAREPCADLRDPWLLRNGEPQRQGGLPALLRLVRRQPRQPARPPARAERQGAMSKPWAAPMPSWRRHASPTRRATTAGRRCS